MTLQTSNTKPYSCPACGSPTPSHLCTGKGGTSTTDLREQVIKAAKVSKASVTLSQKIYSNNTEGPIETTNQEIVEIGIDDLMQLIEAHEAAATQTARLNELSKVPTTKVDIYKLERAAEIKGQGGK